MPRMRGALTCADRVPMGGEEGSRSSEVGASEVVPEVEDGGEEEQPEVGADGAPVARTTRRGRLMIIDL